MIIQRLDILNLIKITSGCLLGCMLASLAGLSYSTSAGIITILSIQNTRRETLNLIIQRISAFFAALIIAYFSFSAIGFTLAGAAFYIFLFGAVCNYFSVQNALVMNTVLIFHFYTEKSLSSSAIQNEVCLLLIGVFCGILMNLYMPGVSGEIRASQQEIEHSFRKLLEEIAEYMTNQPNCFPLEKRLKDLDFQLKRMEKYALEHYGNSLLTDQRYFIKYVEMRLAQKQVLETVCQNLKCLNHQPKQARQIACFLSHISRSFHEYNSAEALLKRLSEIMYSMKNEPLPTTRAEFEDRAILYKILCDLEEFLQLKKHFITALTPPEIQRFWKTENLSSPHIRQ